MNELALTADAGANRELDRTFPGGGVEDAEAELENAVCLDVASSGLEAARSPPTPTSS